MSDSAIRRRKLSDEVRERLHAIIETGRLAPGDELPSERELMRLYEVGRPAIREALQDLERIGLVTIRHGGRARVAEPARSLEPVLEHLQAGVRHTLMHSPATLEHLKEARLMFELQMARLAARAPAAADIRRLRQRIEDQSAVRDDSVRFLQADGAFHREIAVVTGNPIYSAVSEAVVKWLVDFHAGAIRTAGLEQLVLDEHSTIVDLIERRDPEGAAKAMFDHLTRANRLYRHVRADQTEPPS